MEKPLTSIAQGRIIFGGYPIQNARRCHQCLNRPRGGTFILCVDMILDIFAQALSDNNKGLKTLMVKLTERVEAMSETYQDAESDEAKERIDGFIE